MSEYDKPSKIVYTLNYSKNNWIIIPTNSTVNKIISEINDCSRIDSSFGLFEDIYDNWILKNIKRKEILTNKICVRFSKFRVAIKRYRLKKR